MTEIQGSATDGLLAAVAEAPTAGWAVCDIDLDEAYAAVVARGIEIVPTRRGAAAIGVLQPVDPSDAHRLSLSARYGLGEFPLHSDGAHLETPPTIVLLQAERGAPIEPTLLCQLLPGALPSRALAAMRQGVFVVGGGRASFYAHAMDSVGNVRFDPTCMRPLDPSARYVVDFISSASQSVREHDWNTEARLLVIDNRTTLHGRPAMNRQTDRKLRRLMLRWDVA